MSTKLKGHQREENLIEANNAELKRLEERTSLSDSDSTEEEENITRENITRENLIRAQDQRIGDLLSKCAMFEVRFGELFSLMKLANERLDNLTERIDQVEERFQKRKMAINFVENKNFVIESNGKIATKSCDDNQWKMILADCTIPRFGKSSFSVCVRKIGGFRNVRIGIAALTSCDSSWTKQVEASWMLACFDGNIYHSGSPVLPEPPEVSVNDGDIIDVQIDMNNCLLSFKHNGKNIFSQKHHFLIAQEKKEHLVPAVELYFKDESVEFL